MKGRLNLSIHRHLHTSEKGSYLEGDRTVIAISTKKRQSVRIRQAQSAKMKIWKLIKYQLIQLVMLLCVSEVSKLLLLLISKITLQFYSLSKEAKCFPDQINKE